MEWDLTFIKLKLLVLGKGVLGLVIGLIIIKVLNYILEKIFKRTSELPQYYLFQKLISYSLYFTLFIFFLNSLGLDLKVLLGAAGILSVALGFASQTSASNLISGLFLITEKNIKIGDQVIVDDTEGFIESIDLFSTKIRTVDNLLVRFPNEVLMKTKIKNLSYFPIRRIDLVIQLPNSLPFLEVESLWKEVALENPLVLDEPTIKLNVRRNLTHIVGVRFSLWTKRENYIRVRKEVYFTFIEKLKKYEDFNNCSSLSLQLPFT